MNDREHTDNELEIDGETVMLPGPIQNIVTIDDLIIVLFRPPNDEASGRNIRAFDRSGTVVGRTCNDANGEIVPLYGTQNGRR
ncbi:hypothetical protein [Natronococcus wangiae]|uniref:hypothetical protein n=1 Tax=Natronococcus wangiae TaxID=3068275 RepID=UPI00273F6FE8|nr:hypothetical protein [Natronococcus sp. AD5]